MYFKNIVLHWDVSRDGIFFPEHYHFIVKQNGTYFRGKYSPTDNLICRKNYAAHCGGGNTGRIGVCLNGALGYRNKNDPGKYFINQKQVEVACKLCAELCRTYGLSPEQCITHAEFGLDNPRTSSAGKIDINYLPDGTYGIRECGEVLRNKIRWYYERLSNKNNTC